VALQPLARRALAQGRDLGEHAARRGRRATTATPTRCSTASCPTAPPVTPARLVLLANGSRRRCAGRSAPEPFARARDAHLRATIARAGATPDAESYTAKLLRDGVDRIAKKGRRGGHRGRDRGQERRSRRTAPRNGRPRLPSRGALGRARRRLRRRRRGAATPRNAERHASRPAGRRARTRAQAGAAGHRDAARPGRDVSARLPRLAHADPDRRHQTTLAGAREPGAPESSEEIALGRVERVNEFRGRVPDGQRGPARRDRRLKATWFGRRGFAGKLIPGERVFVHGRAALKRTRGAANVELNVLQHRILGEDEVYVGAVVPVYRASKDCRRARSRPRSNATADALAASLPDAMPTSVRARHGLLASAAWREMHRPATPEAAAAARERLIFEEFFGIALAAALKRARRHAAGGAPALAAAGVARALRGALGSR
jgi:hypothetical protein